MTYHPRVSEGVAGEVQSAGGGGVRSPAPGLHDDNSCRANMVKKQLHEADAVWLCSNIRRAVNDKTTKVRPDGAFSTPWKSAAVAKA